MNKNQKLVEDAKGFLDGLKAFHQKEDKEDNSSEVPSPPIAFKRTPGNWPSKETPKIDFHPQSDFRSQFITFVEVHFFLHKRLPSKKEAENKFGKITFQQWDDLTLSTQESLSNRGITPYETPIGYLEPNFVLACNLLSSPHKGMSVSARLKEAGLSTTQWQNLLRQEDHRKYWQDKIDSIFDEDVVADSKRALAELVARNDLPTIKYVNEMKSIYRPNDSNQTILTMLQVIIDIVAMHVTPEVLGKIANQLQESNIIETKELSA